MFEKVNDFLRDNLGSPLKFISSALIGISAAVAVYLGLLQRHFFSRRYLAYAILIALVGTLLSAWINNKYLVPFFDRFQKRIRVFIILFALMMSIILMLNAEVQPVYYLLPDTNLEISFSTENVPAGEEGVRLLWIETGQGYVHYTRLNYEGEWERVFGNTIFPPGQQVRMTWEGKVGHWAEIAFKQTSFPKTVRVSWNGEEETHQLNDPSAPIVAVRDYFQVPISCQLPFIFSFLISLTYLIFALIVFLGSWKIHDKKERRYAKYAWLLYALPMILVWTTSLLIFWPGIMSNDSMVQWLQGFRWAFSDWQSAFHALLLAFLMRIWYSPAIVAILQILTLSVSVAWGLKAFRDGGVHPAVLWMISIAFALFPPNMILSITIWKDIPYAISLLLLTVMILKIVLSEGKWARQKINWIWLGAAAFLVAIFRQNGSGVSALALIILPFVFRKYWKFYLGSLLVAVVLFVGVKGPLYSWMNADNAETGQSNLIYLHHIAAHVEAGTDLSDQETDYLNQFKQIDGWEYWCCYVGTVSYDADFNRGAFIKNTQTNRKLAFDLFLRDPFVDLTHTLCSGELSWKFVNNQCYIKSTHGLSSWGEGEEDWVKRNGMDLTEASVFPNLLQPFVEWLRQFGFWDDKPVYYLRPAFWMYLSLFSMVVAIVRRNDFSYLLPGIPLLAQSLILFLVSFATAYRYHYGTCLCGILLLGCLFLPAKQDRIGS